MKQKGLSRRGRPYGRPAWATYVMIVATPVVILALTLSSVPASYAGEAGKGGMDADKTAKQVTEAKQDSAPGKATPAVKEGQAVRRDPALSPAATGLERTISPVGLREAEAPFVPTTGNKGGKIKRPLLASGTLRGGTSSKFRLGPAPGDKFSVTLGQVGVGSGSSESFGTRGGFWQPRGGVRGDVNGDGAINVGDVIHLVNFLYRDGPLPVPEWAGDFDCDGATNVGDVVQLVNYLYRDGPPPSC
jgi:hypothetical protein